MSPSSTKAGGPSLHSLQVKVHLEIWPILVSKELFERMLFVQFFALLLEEKVLHKRVWSWTPMWNLFFCVWLSNLDTGWITCYYICVDISVMKPWIKMIPVKWYIISLQWKLIECWVRKLRKGTDYKRDHIKLLKGPQISCQLQKGQ